MSSGAKVKAKPCDSARPLALRHMSTAVFLSMNLSLVAANRSGLAFRIRAMDTRFIVLYFSGFLAFTARLIALTLSLLSFFHCRM